MIANVLDSVTVCNGWKDKFSAAAQFDNLTRFEGIHACGMYINNGNDAGLSVFHRYKTIIL